MAPPRSNDERFEDPPPNMPPAERPTRPEPLVDPRTWANERGHEARVPWPEDETTPVFIRKAAPVVLPPLAAPRRPSPLASLIRPTAAPAPARKPTTPGLGLAPDPFPNEESPTPTFDNPEVWLMREGQRLLRNWRACPPDKRRLISAAALRYREDAEGQDRNT